MPVDRGYECPHQKAMWKTCRIVYKVAGPQSWPTRHPTDSENRSGRRNLKARHISAQFRPEIRPSGPSVSGSEPRSGQPRCGNTGSPQSGLSAWTGDLHRVEHQERPAKPSQRRWRAILGAERGSVRAGGIACSPKCNSALGACSLRRCLRRRAGCRGAVRRRAPRPG